MTFSQTAAEALEQFVLPMNLLAVFLLAGSYRALRQLYASRTDRAATFLRRGAFAWTFNSVYLFAELLISYPPLEPLRKGFDKLTLLSIALALSTISSALLLHASLGFWREHIDNDRLRMVLEAFYVTIAFLPLATHLAGRYFDWAVALTVVANAISISVFAWTIGTVLVADLTDRVFLLMVRGSLLAYGILQLVYFERMMHWSTAMLAWVDAIGFAAGTAFKLVHLLGIVTYTVHRARALQQLEQEDAVRKYEKRVVSEMVHELRTPAAELNLQLGHLQSAVLTKGNVKLASRQTADIVTNILAMVSSAFDLVAGMPRLAEEPLERCNLNTLVHAAIMSVKLTAKETDRSKMMSFDTHYTYKPDICGQRTKIKQIFANLVKNAYDAAGPAGGNIRVSTERRRDPSGRTEVSVTVADDGEGIPQRNIAKVTEFGFSTRIGPGRGHGLAIAKRLTEEHGGTLSITSPLRDGHGTSIRVVLPLAGDNHI